MNKERDNKDNNTDWNEWDDYEDLEGAEGEAGGEEAAGSYDDVINKIKSFIINKAKSDFKSFLKNSSFTFGRRFKINNKTSVSARVRVSVNAAGVNVNVTLFALVHNVRKQIMSKNFLISWSTIKDTAVKVGQKLGGTAAAGTVGKGAAVTGGAIAGGTSITADLLKESVKGVGKAADWIAKNPTKTAVGFGTYELASGLVTAGKTYMNAKSGVVVDKRDLGGTAEQVNSLYKTYVNSKAISAVDVALKEDDYYKRRVQEDLGATGDLLFALAGLKKV